MKFINKSLALLLPLLAVTSAKACSVCTCSEITSYLSIQVGHVSNISNCVENSEGYVTELKLFTNGLSVEQVNTIITQERLKTLYFDTITSSESTTSTTLKSTSSLNVFPTAISSLEYLETAVLYGISEIKAGDLQLIPSSVKVIGLGEIEATQYIVDDLSTLTNVEELKLLSTTFSQEVSMANLNKLEELKKIRIENYETEKVTFDPIIITELQSLEEVNIENYSLSQETITDISALTNLKTLGLYSCDYEENISISSLQNLQYLESLAVTGQESATDFPFEEIYQISSIQYLDLSQNNLQEISQSILELKQLKSINYSHNHLTVVPSFFGNLYTLEQVNFEYNEITSISSNISSLTKLTSANFCSNLIEELPKAFYTLDNLQYLNLESNRITTFSSEYTSLKSLNVLRLNNNLIDDAIPSVYSNTNISINIEGNINVRCGSFTFRGCSGSSSHGHGSSSGRNSHGHGSSSGRGSYGHGSSSGRGSYGHGSSSGRGSYGNGSSSGRGSYGNGSSSGRGSYGNGSSSGRGSNGYGRNYK